MTRLAALPLVGALALLTLAACDPGGDAQDADEGDGDGDGPDDPRFCAGPGSSIGLPEVTAPDWRFFTPSDPEVGCASDWSAELGLAPEWTTLVSEGLSAALTVELAPFPSGGVVLANDDRLMRFDAEGELLWSRTNPLVYATPIHVTPDGHVVCYGRVVSSGPHVIVILDAEGDELTTVDLDFGTSFNVGPVVGYGEDFIVSAQLVGVSGTFLLRFDSDGQELLRHDLDMNIDYELAADQQGTILFGLDPGLLLDGEGAILKPDLQLDAEAVVGAGVGFYANLYRETDGALRDGVQHLDEQAAEQWWRGRARGDAYMHISDIARTPSGAGVLGGEESPSRDYVGYNTLSAGAFGSQPLILGFDETGELEWIDRVLAVGRVESVAVDPQGQVYAAGAVQHEPHANDGTVSLFLRSYRP